MTTLGMVVVAFVVWPVAAYGVAVLLRSVARRIADDYDYPDDRDDYAREQAIEDGRMEYER